MAEQGGHRHITAMDSAIFLPILAALTVSIVVIAGILYAMERSARRKRRKSWDAYYYTPRGGRSRSRGR